MIRFLKAYYLMQEIDIFKGLYSESPLGVLRANYVQPNPFVERFMGGFSSN